MTMTPTDAHSALQIASWRLRARVRPDEDLVALAVDSLTAGLDGPLLAELAGADAYHPQDVRDLFADVVREQGLEWPDEQAALWQLVRYTARQIVDGVLDPETGAQWISNEAADRAEPEGDLRIFKGIASELDDPRPDHRPHYHRMIVRVAAELLARGEPRRWLRVQADTQRPLSIATTNGPVPADLADIPLPPHLVSQVSGWARDWRQVLATRGFASMTDAERFVHAGRELAAALQGALGTAWHVEYYPEPTRPPGVRLSTA